MVFPESSLVMAMLGEHPFREHPGSVSHSPAQACGPAFLPWDGPQSQATDSWWNCLEQTQQAFRNYNNGTYIVTVIIIFNIGFSELQKAFTITTSSSLILNFGVYFIDAESKIQNTIILAFVQGPTVGKTGSTSNVQTWLLWTMGTWDKRERSTG